MTKFFSILFFMLCLAGKGQAQQINTIEYFFDTDPGFGAGKTVNALGSSIDADFNFDVTGLTNGIHLLTTRIRNSDNKWSMLYQNTLFVQNGTAGATQIVAAEYYFDTDPGFGKGKQISLATPSLDSTLQFSLDGLVTGIHTIYVRLKNNSNEWSPVYQGNFILSAGIGNSLITAAEYYFDTDPGFSKGTQVAINKSSVDSVINFSVNGLQPGIHTFYLRLKNNQNNWSVINQGNFILFSGTSGLPQISMLDYFVDSVKNNIAITLNPKALLDTTLSINIPDNGGDKRVLGIQLNDQGGRKGNAALIDVSMCDLYKPQAGFRYTQYGATFSLIDTSHFNTTQTIRWLANNKLTDSNYTINYTIPASSIPGSVLIKNLSGKGCRVDTASQTLNMPGVENFAPFTGSYNSDFNLNLYGGGLDTNLVVYLQNGNTIVYPYIKLSSDGNQHLIAVFDFHSFKKTFGYPALNDNYIVHVKYNNGYEYIAPADKYIAMQKQGDNTKLSCGGARLVGDNTCNGGRDLIRVQDPDYISTDSVMEPFFATDLTGPNSMRTGVWTNYNLSITNAGTVVAKGIPFYVMVPANFDIDTKIWNMFNPDPAMTDSIGVITPIDTVINGRHVQYKLIAMIYPLLAPGETGNFPLRLRTNTVTPYHIFYAVQDRMFGSPMTYLFGPCWGGVADFVIGFIPGVSCFYAFGNLINDQINFGLNNNNDRHSVFALGLSYVGTGVSCIPGGGPLKQISNAFSKEMGFTRAALGSVEDAANIADKGLNVIGGVNSYANSTDPCSKVKQKSKKKDGNPVASFDPNYITGNSDYDTLRHYINNYSPQQFTIGFENKPSATANAQHVFLADTLNTQKFNIRTLQLSQFTIADSIYSLPAFRYKVTTDVALKNRKDMKVRFVADFDTARGILSADFFSIDTLGNAIPLSSTDGFLPPDTDGSKGTGSLSYSVYALNLNTLDTFSNKAAIYFDNNAPISTNIWQNTVDTTRPQGRILSTIVVNDSTVKLVMQGADVGSGLAYHTFYAKSNTDTKFSTIGVATGDTVIFKGKANQSFQVFSKATDNVGNIQQKDSVADVTVIFSKALPLKLLSFTGKIVNEKTELNWSTTNEINTASFDVERSVDGSHFIKMGNVLAKNLSTQTNNYNFTDKIIQYGYNYYRLKQIDANGSFVYSLVVKLNYTKNGFVTIGPNPARDFVDIQSSGKINQMLLVDASGKNIKVFIPTTGSRYPLTGISKGIYFLKVMIDGQWQTFKLIIDSQ
jgi:hypothetical protein